MPDAVVMSVNFTSLVVGDTAAIPARARATKAARMIGVWWDGPPGPRPAPWPVFFPYPEIRVSSRRPARGPAADQGVRPTFSTFIDLPLRRTLCPLSVSSHYPEPSWARAPATYSRCHGRESA